MYISVACLLFGLMAGVISPANGATTNANQAPNLLINGDRIRIIKERLAADDPLISSAYRQLIADANRYLRQSPDPITGDLKIPGFYQQPEAQRKITSRIKHDAKAANCLALAFALSADEKYGLKAKEFLFAWVRNLGRPRDGGSLLDIFTLMHRGDTPLVITYTFPNFMYAFDILDGLGRLSQEESAAFHKWLKVYVAYCTGECFYKNNHHNWQSLFLMCAGHVLRDPGLFDRGLRYYQNGFRVQILRDGALPLELWRKEKCATYSLMALEAMLQGACIASRHGHPEILDLRSKEKGSLKDAVDCLVSFLDAPDTWQVNKRKSHTGFSRQNRPDDPSDWGWALEIPSSWWQDDKYLKYMTKRPYGEAVRAYTLTYSTLLFSE